jgi:succinoglycan biosynthesis transport protein ExoP
MAHTFAGPYGIQAQPVSEASIGDLLRAVRTHWRYIVVPTLLVFLGSVIFVSVVAPRYTGESKVLLQAGESYYTRPGQDRNDQAQLIDEQAVASQVQVVMSRDLARAAIKRLGLVGNPEFDPGVQDVGLMQRIMGMLGMARTQEARPPEERVLERYYDHLLVYPVGKSRIVSVEFRSKDPDLASRAANTVAELYLDLQEDAKKDQARSASTWLGSSIDDLRKRVAEAEAKVEAFRARNGLFTGSGTASMPSQQLSELTAQLAQARMSQTDAQARAQLIRDLIRDGRGFEIPDVANNELIRRLIEQRINLRAQLALEQRTLLPQHPRIKELNAQVQDLEAQIRGAAERTSRTLENDSRIAASRVQQIEAAIEQQKKVVVLASESEVQLRALEREARTQRDQLESYLTRYREAMARDVGNAAPPDARIVSRAVTPQVPSFPKKLPIVAITTFAALMLSAGAIVARELLGTGAPGAAYPVHGHPGGQGPSRNVPDETEAPRAEPVFTFDMTRFNRERAMLPLAAAAADAPTAERPEPDPRYDFGNLVERLRKEPVADRARRVLVTGVDRGGEPKDVARGLALTLARDERAVLIEIDPDESAPSREIGLTDLIAGEASFANVIRRESGSKLHRIGAGSLRNEALTGEPGGLDVALSALDKTYDWVVCVFMANSSRELMQLVAPRVDAVVIASNLEPANQDLVRTYEDAHGAGAKDVVVAREQAPPVDADSEAA